ncbi:unnamed protein product [Merluccius merluccius]
MLGDQQSEELSGTKLRPRAPLAPGPHMHITPPPPRPLTPLTLRDGLLCRSGPQSSALGETQVSAASILFAAPDELQALGRDQVLRAGRAVPEQGGCEKGEAVALRQP